VRLIKMFGLAAIAVGAFMAFLGATSASATTLENVVLCRISNEDPCAAGNRLGSGTVLHATSVTEPLLLAAFDVKCLSSKILGATNSTLAHGEITALSFTHCYRVSTGKLCTATAERLNYLIKGELQPGDSGYETLVTAGSSGLRPEVFLDCPEDSIECKYGVDSLLSEALGGSGSADTVLDVLQTLSGLGICFVSATWHAEYLVKCLEGTSEVSCWLRME
jgi:hypothetical protein